MTESARVFISYSHDSIAHRQRVRRLSDRLRRHNLDSNIDQYEQAPEWGWPRWMLDQIETAAFVLAICTEIYDRRVRGHEEIGKGAGASFEGLVITQEVYEALGRNRKFIPVIFEQSDYKHIPIFLRGTTIYKLYEKTGFRDLRDRLTNYQRTPKPPLGSPQKKPASNKETAARQAGPTAQEERLSSQAKVAKTAPSRSAPTITAESVEATKIALGFDRELASALMVRNPRRRLIAHPVLGEQIVATIRETVDGPLTRFIASGGRQVPRSIFNRRLVRGAERFRTSPGVERALRKLIERVWSENHKHYTQKDVRSTTIRATVLVTEIVRRSRLVEII
jgi:hypothetical protein